MEPKLLQPMARPQILAAAATGVERAITAAGIDAHRVFDLAGIDSARITDPSLRLELGDYCRLFDIAARQSGDDFFGARFGSGFTPPHFSAVGGLVANAPTLKEGLAALARHYGWIQGNSIVGFSVQDGIAMLDYRICDARIPCKQQDAELTLAAFCGLIRAFLGPSWRPLEAHFEHGRGGRRRDYEKIFGETLFFDQATNRLVIEAAQVERPIPSPDPRAFAGSRAVIRCYLERVDLIESAFEDREAVLGLVADIIESQCKFGDVGIDTVARRLGLSVGGLRRRLKRYDAPYDELLLSVRQGAALRYVTRSDRDLTEIALLLGYSDLSAFSRAFRLWHGTSPSACRRAARP